MKLEVRTLSQIHGQESLSVVGDLMSPLFEIATDKAIEAVIKSEEKNNTKKMAKMVKLAISKHSDAIYELLSILAIDKDTGERPSKDEYIENCNPGLIFRQVMIVFNDDSMQELFLSQSQTTPSTSTGSATENTEA